MTVLMLLAASQSIAKDTLTRVSDLQSAQMICETKSDDFQRAIRSSRAMFGILS